MGSTTAPSNKVNKISYQKKQWRPPSKKEGRRKK
jgi:hypothetical protein